MKLSHSKLGVILSCPMTYYLKYVEGISLKKKKASLEIGSAVHWGIEHHTEDLSEYFNKIEYERDQLLAEAMVHGYFKQEDSIMKDVLTDPKTGQTLDLIDTYHELEIYAKLKSFRKEEPHEFMGIIDLLLLTNMGFIILDYKTSTYEPDWNNYTDQLYRYIFLLKSQFPDIPVIKIGIINLRKSAIRQKKNENESEFLNRLKFEYEVNDENLINYHEFSVDLLDPVKIKDYIENMSRMADTAQMLVDNNVRFINYGAANGVYGKSDYWDIFYHTQDNQFLYKIKDPIYDEYTGKIEPYRDCVELDMKVIGESPILNHYSKFKDLLEKSKIIDLENHFDNFISECKLAGYLVDEDLMRKYYITYLMEKN